MITISMFSQLKMKEQADMLYQHGVYVGKQRNALYSIVLYQLDSFYVEVYYRKYRFSIVKIHCFCSIDKLQPYLWQVNVDVLLNV
ncbi:hypothetical protein [Aridibaculum aurantiacum]|uniref:hypothetical protein n=1 Tax=Aridibaculum aurantiacum TaxID=2810307 RepID=UPI001A9734AC|nr:hypothetical protein [Aridibaculum aurantiacum]